MKYTTETDIYAFGVLWAELMQAVHPHHVSMVPPKKKDDITGLTVIILNNPPSEGFEGKLFDAGLGNKPIVPEVLQDTARNIVNKWVFQSFEQKFLNFCDHFSNFIFVNCSTNHIANLQFSQEKKLCKLSWPR